MKLNIKIGKGNKLEEFEVEMEDYKIICLLFRRDSVCFSKCLAHTVIGSAG